jgi:TetR/AcrR family transcriptional regulator, transcriptional repressor for nem operon
MSSGCYVCTMSPKAAHLAKRERTRQRILDVAAIAFRKHGIDGVGVRDIMKQSGLTQGGFYFHFRDKEALFAEASRNAVTAGSEWLYDSIKNAPPGKELQSFIDTYLSPAHRDRPESGCLLSALGSDLARSDEARRREFSKLATAILDRISPYVPGPDPDARRRRAGVLLASMAGVLMAARVLGDSERSRALLSEARHFFSENFRSM